MTLVLSYLNLLFEEKTLTLFYSIKALYCTVIVLTVTSPFKCNLAAIVRSEKFHCDEGFTIFNQERNEKRQASKRDN